MGTPVDEPDVRLVRDFVNTLDVETGTDTFASAPGLTTWLRERDLLGQREQAGAADLALARDLRECLRAELRSHHGSPPDAEGRRDLDAIAARLPLRVAFGLDGPNAPSGPALAPVGIGAPAALAAVLAAVAALARTGEWRRLKVCPAEECQWAFYDESRNRSRRWCSMEACGNRAKLRTFRGRQAGSRDATRST
jgi:predicted RNA-binding Zn ribbon-like protein